MEVAIAKSQDKVIVTSNYALDLFKQKGCDNFVFAPLGFDEDFHRTDRTYLKDVTHFGLMGKFEKRKNTAGIIKAWLKKYGNNNKYQLSCCITNPFFKPEQMNEIINGVLEGKRYSNINFLPYLKTNQEVNELLNAIDIDLTGLSFAEGWNLPSFNATCLGKWSIVSNATSHKDWATDENSILVECDSHVDSHDGAFFLSGQSFNQGTFPTYFRRDPSPLSTVKQNYSFGARYSGLQDPTKEIFQRKTFCACAHCISGEYVFIFENTFGVCNWQ
jgi:hypothetical protein